MASLEVIGFLGFICDRFGQHDMDITTRNAMECGIVEELGKRTGRREGRRWPA